MDVLTLLQYNLLKQLANSELNQVFFLAGGTALSAFFLHHRYSEDLDFFTEQPEQVPDDYWLAVSLMKVRELGPLPRMLKPMQVDELKNFFLTQARLLMR